MAVMHGERLVSNNDWHVYTGTSLLLLGVVMTVMRMSLLAERFLQLLMLTTYCNAIDVHRYRHHKTRSFPAAARH